MNGVHYTLSLSLCNFCLMFAYTRSMSSSSVLGVANSIPNTIHDAQRPGSLGGDVGILYIHSHCF